MIYWIRPECYVEMPWYYVMICDVIDCVDDMVLGNEDTGWFADWIAGIWLEIIFKFKEHKHEVHHNSECVAGCTGDN